ncbi:MAG: class D beta-lactamase [Chitinophagaceae bacterium]|uniref:penicillin-binding transpeptidase domain-containing protein n=1 Tax=unclassified Paraflavitalea TaxID=2798305 RepID=UPI003D32953C|nr:class D beta-lactamase [Chitinophagaceae bacterium]
MTKLFNTSKLVPAFVFVSFYLIVASCTPDNIKEDDSLKTFFDEHKSTGTFGLYSNGTGSFNIYNLSRFADSTYTPASTFKIVNSLIGTELGIVPNDSTVLDWGFRVSGRTECDTPLTMREAFRRSCPNWYQKLAQKIGVATMQRYLDTLGYGARYKKFVIKNNLDTFWLNNDLKVTADEELGVVKKLYFNQLPFQNRTQELVRNMMLWEDNANYKLYYKTGWGTTPSGNQLGWIVGWIEENKHPYFFALQVESPDSKIDMKTVRLSILKNILKKYGFFEGKK